MELFWWFFTIVLLAVGLIGSVLPAIPGATIILAAAVIHRIMLGPEKSLGWRALTALVLLTLATYLIDVLSGYFGAKYFGATKWGTFGAIIGAIGGLFFGIIGLFVGPVIGAIAGEFIAGKRMIDAGRAGWGSLLGNIGGMIAKLVIALAMITIFLVNTPSPF
jgi:uncharacterized protein YqgC (DUF456 family)